MIYIIKFLFLIRQLSQKYINPGPLKEAMKMIGIDCGDPILPLVKPSKQVVDSLAIELKKLTEWYK